MDTPAQDSPAGTGRTRRSVLASLVAAGAVAAFATRASAEGDGSASTTTAPPERDPADKDILNALIAREADMAATYGIAAGSASGDDAAALKLIGAHHLAYVQALTGYLGRDAVAHTGTTLTLSGASYAALAPQLARHEADTAETHVKALASIRGVDAAALVASIVTVEARHVAALLVSASGTVQSLESALATN